MDPIPYYVAGGAKRKTAKKVTNIASKVAQRRIFDYLSVCKTPEACNAAIKAAPDSVIKTICNAAVNVKRNRRVHLTPGHRKLFARQGDTIDKLLSRKVGLKTKRKLLKQTGGAFWIPALIGAAISSIGSSLFGGNKS